MKKPDFIICGAQKCGTTTLMNQLNEHPNIYVADSGVVGGEMHFFYTKKEGKLSTYDNGIEWYKKHFPDDGRITGEKTPGYIFKQTSPRLIKKHIPDIKLIFILRDPVKRAYSQYHMDSRNWNLDSDFPSFKECIMEGDYKHANSEEYIKRGIYWRQLQRYKNCFDNEQMLILVLRELKEHPEKVYQQIYDFLDVPSILPLNPQKKHYRGGVARSASIDAVRYGFKKISMKTKSLVVRKLCRLMMEGISLINVKGQFMEYLTGKEMKGYPPMDDEVEEMLYQYFKPYNEKLKKKFPDLNIEHWFR